MVVSVLEIVKELRSAGASKVSVRPDGTVDVEWGPQTPYKSADDTLPPKEEEPDFRFLAGG